MAKNLSFCIEREEGTHQVSLEYSYVSGKAIVTINGDRFDISVRPFRLRGTQQAFRLGEEMALLDFPKRGEPDILMDGVSVRAK